VGGRDGGTQAGDPGWVMEMGEPMQGPPSGWWDPGKDPEQVVEVGGPRQGPRVGDRDGGTDTGTPP